MLDCTALRTALRSALRCAPGPEGGGIREDTVDSLHMAAASRPLQAVLLVDMACLLLYNVAGMAVTGHMGAVFRTVLEVRAGLHYCIARCRHNLVVTLDQLRSQQYR